MLVLFAAVLQIVSMADAHVALTFPPARKYNLDFLDTFRTETPCGMAKGDVKTTIPNGQPLKVKWHLGYAHRGTFMIELLDKSGKKVRDLTTPSGQFITAEKTAQAYEAEIPSDLTCNDCTIRLLRQALEWGKSYRFQSCADVDIVAQNEYTNDCSGHGSLSGSTTCSCDKTYFGDRCQFKNECETDAECGTSSKGKCIDLEGTALPQKQCFCKPGYFGRDCSKVSQFKAKGFNMSMFNVETFGATTKFFWRIDGSEVDGIITAKTESFLAVGWRPKDSDKSCHDVFPKDALKIKGRDFNAMDCLDIVLGTVKEGTLSRIADYYTRDRSTPRMDDELWGETDDLKAAIGWEEDGSTFIRFRKPVSANGGSDHDFNGNLHVVWAHGRSDDSFYGVDELKYHGPNKGYSEMLASDSSRNRGHGLFFFILLFIIMH